MNGALIGILGALAGIVLSGGVTLFISWRNFQREKAEKQRVVTMQVAAQLRRWLIETARTFRDQPIFYQPDPNSDPGDPYGYYFPVPSDIPPFPFGEQLEQISLLRNDDAQSLFNLIEQRLSAERQASISAELDDYEKAAEVFEPLIAEVYLTSVGIYEKLAKQVGWNKDAVNTEELKDMRERASPAQKEPAATASESQLNDL